MRAVLFTQDARTNNNKIFLQINGFYQIKDGFFFCSQFYCWLTFVRWLLYINEYWKKMQGFCCKSDKRREGAKCYVKTTLCYLYLTRSCNNPTPKLWLLSSQVHMKTKIRKWSTGTNIYKRETGKGLFSNIIKRVKWSCWWGGCFQTPLLPYRKLICFRG